MASFILTPIKSFLVVSHLDVKIYFRNDTGLTPDTSPYTQPMCCIMAACVKDHQLMDPELSSLLSIKGMKDKVH